MFRQEQKFFLNFIEVSKILSKFNANAIFPLRQINSIYYDSENLHCYYNSDEGSVPRKKYRFRWYGNINEIPARGNIEIKTTYENYKTKYSNNVTLNNLIELEDLVNIYSDNEYLRPKCQVSYDRLYYSNISGVRFTYDYNIKYKDMTSSNFIKSNFTIFEVKYSNIDNSIFPSILGDRMVRFSKYNDAMMILYNL